MRQKCTCVDVDGVPARWLHDRYASLDETVAQIRSQPDAIRQVVLFERFVQTYGDRFEFAPCESTISWIVLRENQKVLFKHRFFVVVCTQEATNIGEAVFLRRHSAAVRVMEHFLSDIPWVFPRVAGLAHLDEICIFGEPARVQVQGYLVSRADF